MQTLILNSGDEVIHDENALITATEQAGVNNPAAAYLLSKTHDPHDIKRNTTRKTMGFALVAVLKALDPSGKHTIFTYPWWELGYGEANALRAYLEKNYAAATANLYITAVRGVIHTAAMLDYLPMEKMHKVHAALKAIKVSGVTVPHGRDLSEEEIQALFSVTENGPLGARDRAMLAVMLGSGLRREEVVLLQSEDIEYDEKLGLHKITVVHGKGDKGRVVFSHPYFARFIDEWRDRYRGDAPGYFFCNVKELMLRGAIDRLQPQTVKDRLEALYRLAKSKGYPVEEFKPHDLRRWFITNMLRVIPDNIMVSKLAGHASIQTTMKYDHRTMVELASLYQAGVEEIDFLKNLGA